MLAGFVLTAILAGSLSLAISVLAGHAFLVSLLFYSLAGCCGVLALACRALQAEDPMG